MCVCFLYYFSPKCIVKMCHLSAMHLSRCVVFGQGALCVCVFFIIDVLNALSRCVVFRQCTCQDVSSMGKGPCVCVCVFFITDVLNALSRCVVFQQCTCQDVSSLGRCLVCVFFLLISAINALSRCVVFRQCTVKMCHLWAGGFVCVCAHVCMCSFFLFLPKMHCQDVSSFGNAPVKMCRLWAGALCVCVLHY